MAAVKVEPNNNVTVPKQYGKIVITLDNCLLPSEKLKPTPSSLDGLDEETEMDLRILGCELIQTAGILLKLPQVAMATGQVLFQRFFYAKSFVKQNMEVVAMGCVCLASKIEEAPRRIRDVINVFHHIKQVRGGKTIQPMILDQNYINLKNQVIKAERRVLKELGFCVHVKHPHKIIVTFLNQVLDCKRNRQLAQLSWNYMNDSLRTNVFVRYSPEKIACSCIFLSARELKIPLPTKPAWFDIFDVTENEIEEICKAILRLYVRAKPDADKLEKVVDDLKKLQLEAKLKARGMLEGTFVSQPNSNQTSRSNSPLKNDKSPLEGEVKKEKGKDEGHSRDGRSNRSPTTGKDSNHVGQKHSPDSKESRSSKARSRSRSRSTSPSKRKRTPPRSYKEVRKSPGTTTSANSAGPPARSRSRSGSRSGERGAGGRGESRKDRNRAGHKRKRSKSRSPRRHHHHHNHKKNSHRDKSARRRSRSRERDQTNAGSQQHEKVAVTVVTGSSRTSRRDRQRDNGHHRSRSKERNAAPR